MQLGELWRYYYILLLGLVRNEHVVNDGSDFFVIGTAKCSCLSLNNDPRTNSEVSVIKNAFFVPPSLLYY